jgi:formylglycine-generating enzyme required for sulfatase activity
LRLVRQFERDARDWQRRGRPPEMQPRNEQLQLLLNAAAHLDLAISNPLLIEYADLDVERLLAELTDIDTPHARRLYIGERIGFLGDPTPGIGLIQREGDKIAIPEITWCYVPADNEPSVEIKDLRFALREFFMAKYPVTNQQFKAFIDDPEGYDNPRWWAGLPPQFQRVEILPSRGQFPNLPREMVTWYQAVAFTKWLTAHYSGERLEHPTGTFVIGENAEIRLPTEWEWQWAAQGGREVREFPWEGGWDTRRANTFESHLAAVTIGQAYPHGAALCGVFDLAGNLWEWCLNEFESFNVVMDSTVDRCVHGGSFVYIGDFARAAARSNDAPFFRNSNVGFRVVCAARD